MNLLFGAKGLVLTMQVGKGLPENARTATSLNRTERLDMRRGGGGNANAWPIHVTARRLQIEKELLEGERQGIARSGSSEN